MGGGTALNFGLEHPEMTRALIVAGAGTGSTDPDRFRRQCTSFAEQLEEVGMKALDEYALGPARVQLRRKDPDGWREFAELLGRHSPLGSALQCEGFRAAGDDLREGSSVESTGEATAPPRR